MPELLSYNFEVVGMANVERALSSLERRFAQHNAKMARDFGRTGTGAAGRGTGGGLRAGTEGMAGTAALRETTRMMRKVEREEASSVKRTERERVSSERRVWNEKVSQTKKFARIQVQEEVAAAQKIEAARKAFRKTTVGDTYGRFAGGIKAVGKAGLVTAGVAGAGLAASSISQALTLDEASRRLAISARGAGEGDQFSAAQIQKQAQQNAIATGMSPESLIAASQNYVGRTGDIKGAMAHQKTFAIFAQATGSSTDEVASVGADLAMKFGITGVKEMGDALAVLGFQGKKGAFEIKDMANTFPEMAAAAQRAGLKGVGGMKTLGGLAQIARQSTGSGAEASTALQMMLTQLIAKSGKLKSGESLGGRSVDVFEGGDPTKDARSIPTVLAEIISKSHGNLQQLGELFDVRGIRAASPMISAYREAATGMRGKMDENGKWVETKVGKGAAGGAAAQEAAGKAAIMKLIEDASTVGGDFTDIQKDAADAMKSVNVQLEIIGTQLRAVVAAELFPVFVRLAPRLAELVPTVAYLARELTILADVAASNPFSTLGVVVGKLIGEQIGKAMIADVLEKGITTKLGAGGLVIGTVLATVSMAKLYVAEMYEKAKSDVEMAAASGDAIRQKAHDELAATGTITPETKAKLVALHQTEQDTTKKGGDALNEGTLDLIGRGFNSLTGREHNLQEFATLGEAAGNTKYQSGAMDTERLLAVSEILEKGGKAAAEAMKAGAIEAAKSISDAKPSGVNTGNSPSPVKP